MPVSTEDPNGVQTVNAVEAGEILGISSTAVAKRINTGKLAGEKVGQGHGGEWRIPREAVLRQRHAEEFADRTREGLEREWDAAYAYSVAGMLEAAREAYSEYQKYQDGNGDLEEMDATVVAVLEAADRVRAVRDSRTIVDHMKRMAGGFLSNNDAE